LLDLFIGGEARADGYDNYPFKTAECVLVPVHSPSKAERLRDSKLRYFKLLYRRRGGNIDRIELEIMPLSLTESVVSKYNNKLTI
jgi:hypothetical protein